VGGWESGECAKKSVKKSVERIAKVDVKEIANEVY